MTLRAGTLLPASLVACALQLSACATVTRTEHADWKVDTIPQGAALTASNGWRCDATPCTLRVRRKESFTATMTKDGYKPMTVAVRPGMTPAGDVAFVGNILIGGVIGMGVDLYTGAALEPTPSGTPFRLSPVSYASMTVPRPETLYKPVSAPVKAAAPTAGGLMLQAAVDCPPEKASYAAFLGVPCAALGGVVPGLQPASLPALQMQR